MSPAARSAPDAEEQEFFEARFGNPPVVLCAFGSLASELLAGVSRAGSTAAPSDFRWAAWAVYRLAFIAQ